LAHSAESHHSYNIHAVLPKFHIEPAGFPLP